MAFWSGDKLTTAIPAKKIVEPFYPKQVDCSAYTLTLGEEYFITPDYTVSVRENTTKALAESKRWDQTVPETKRLMGGPLNIPAGQFAFLMTEEALNIPQSVMGFISLKSSAKWRGLINVSGFHVDPGFKGKLIYSVYNAGPSPIHLKRGQDLFLLWLADLDRSATTKFAKPQNAAPLVEIPPQMVTDVNRQIHSLDQLSIKLSELENKIRFIWWAGGLVGVLAAILLGVLSLRPSSETPAPSESAVSPPAAQVIAPPAPAPIPAPGLAPVIPTAPQLNQSR
jgi:dCTP deaminase